MATSASIPHISVDDSLGALFVGFAASCVVYGISLAQIFKYFRSYPGDRSLFKWTVIAILLLETADQIFIAHGLYFYSISNYANPLAVINATMTWSLILQLTAGAVVGSIVKFYFGLRVWRFSNRNIWITGLILLLVLGQLGLAFAFTVECFKLPGVFAVTQLKTLGTIALGIGVATDFVTAGALCYFLNKLKTGFKPSDSLVHHLVSYAINTGVLTSTVSLTTLILFNVCPPTSLYFLATYCILSKLYAISFMATLNTRRTVRGRGTDRQDKTDNNTNMFHLGTRVPSMNPRDLQNWDLVYPPPLPTYTSNEDDFPYNSYYNSTDKVRPDAI